MEEYTCEECGWSGTFCNYNDGPVCPWCGADLETDSPCSACSCDGSCKCCEHGD